MLFLFIFIFLLILLYMDYRPVKKLEVCENEVLPLEENEIENFNNTVKRYDTAIHIHTQFSRDSLGKPSDIKKAMEDTGMDYAFITDHDNDYYKFFEDEKTFTGVEKNTENGRMIFLANKIPVISHPNNFEFDHYRWKGEFKKEYLYELINIKDAIVWNRLLTVISLIKNIFFYPFFRNLLRKWNGLIPLEKWVSIYFERAKGLKIVGGLDVHIKFAYQEHTHGVLIPSYKSAFTWLVNSVYSFKKFDGKEEILERIEKGNLMLFLNRNYGDVWLENKSEIYFVGDKCSTGSCLNVLFEGEKKVKIVKFENSVIAITEREKFKICLEKEGFYHVEVYEYDFKIGNLYFGFRPVAVTNLVEVV